MSTSLLQEISSTKQVFIPQERAGHPFDITLVVGEDGKQFKAHRHVLSEASPFFEKLLNSDMRESNEGLIRLEMLTELGLRYVLEFIYTGNVRMSVMSTEDNAKELIAIADYLVLPHLKTQAGKVLEDKLSTSNSISTLYFAQRYHCEELTLQSKKFISANFTAVAKSEEFFNLTHVEVKTLISSNEINVSAEEDVFKIILAWIDHDNTERKRYFGDLFREVRLVYVSHDFLLNDIVRNDLVYNSDGGIDLVKDALKLIGSKNGLNHRIMARKSLEASVILVCLHDWNYTVRLFCYNPGEDKWSTFPLKIPKYTERLFSCLGRLYFLSERESRLLCYDSFSNSWTSLPYKEQRRLCQFILGDEDEIYAQVSEDDKPFPECFCGYSNGMKQTCGNVHTYFITKYIASSNLWEDITSVALDSKEGRCIVAKGNFMYFIGGRCVSRNHSQEGCMRGAYRLDLSAHTWDTIADLQEPRFYAYGTAACGKIFIAGGYSTEDRKAQSCEVYDEATKQWHYTLHLKVNPGSNLREGRFVCGDGELYLISRAVNLLEPRIIKCFDAGKNEWKEQAEIPRRFLKEPSVASRYFHRNYVFCCSVKVFKGCVLFRKAFADMTGKTNCAIM